MSAENNKVCCNCRHCIRSRDEKYDIIICRCEINKIYLGYEDVMGGWCRHWAKEREDE